MRKSRSKFTKKEASSIIKAYFSNKFTIKQLTKKYKLSAQQIGGIVGRYFQGYNWK